MVGDATLGEAYEPYQACVDMSAPKTRGRKIESLRVAMRETGLTHGTIVALREADHVSCEEGEIDVVPAWRWALVGHKA